MKHTDSFDITKELKDRRFVNQLVDILIDRRDEVSGSDWRALLEVLGSQHHCSTDYNVRVSARAVIAKAYKNINGGSLVVK